MHHKDDEIELYKVLLYETSVTFRNSTRFNDALMTVETYYFLSALLFM